MVLTHHTYLVRKMLAPNGILSTYDDLIISLLPRRNLAATSTSTVVATVMVAQAAKIDPTTQEVPKQKCTSTALDASLAVKKICFDLPDASKEVTIGADLDTKYEVALTIFLWDNIDIFVCSPSDMPGVQGAG
jgi:hypothetical protein